MTKSLTKPLMILLFAAGAGIAGTAAADQDPSLQQVYQAAENGHLAQAQQMMGQVLKDHPNSAKAHYVTSELDAKAGQFAEARDEFHTAEKLDPGLGFAKADSVNALRAELFPASSSQLPARTTQTVVTEVPVRQQHSGFPFGTVIGIGFLVWIVWLIFFRRRVVSYGGPVGYRGPDGYMGGGMGGGMGGPGPYYGGGGYGGGGIGSSLASGLAVGAGVAVGEELTERLLDGGGRERMVERGDQPVEYRDQPQNDLNGDMGGSDFGVSDSGGWDDNSGGGGGDSGGGGSDW